MLDFSDIFGGLTVDAGSKLLVDAISTNVSCVGLKYIRATTRDFKQCGVLTSVDTDEPVQPPFKLRHSK